VVDGEDLAGGEAALGLSEAEADGAVRLRDEACWRGFIAVTHTGEDVLFADERLIDPGEVARDGFTGARRILEGPTGMAAGMSTDAEPACLVDRLGERWALAETSFKFHASCRHTHPAADALLDLMQSRGLAADDVASVRCHVHQGAIDVLGPVTDPRSIHQSKFSMGFVLAQIALQGRAGLGEFTDPALRDARVRSFLERVTMVLDPEVDARLAQAEMAYRMQSSAPELMDISKESKETLESYGAEPGKASFANNCLLARRLVERGVRFVQLFHEAWDHHSDVKGGVKGQAGLTDKACAALIRDLKTRGLLDDTLVVWGGEFGRTVYCQGRLTETNYGRDHHPRCFTMWFAGGGIKGGQTIGETDDYSYNVVKDPVHVHDMQATLLHCLGVDHLKLTYKFQGRYFRLTDVHGNLVKQMVG
jgi:hypothetical protein